MRILVALSLLLCLAGMAQAGTATPAITITAPAGQPWSVRYDLPEPARRLLFARSPDSSRKADWKPQQGFEIFASPQGEGVRRIDGAPFGSVSLTLTPAYRTLPNDYAPFSPFGDGGMLFHSGRFFACIDSCPVDGAWDIRLSAPDRLILVDGRSAAGTAQWVDDGEGRSIYVGDQQPIATPDLMAVFDRALPETIRSPLAGELPRFMHYFAARLGALPSPPMLFASYDISDQGGRYGRQGGVLPGQVFTHFYGAVWPEEMKKPNFANDLLWFFAHEAGHLYQHGIEAGDGGAWIHEGAAEAFAALAMPAIRPGSEAFVAAKIAAARADCDTGLAGKPLRAAIAGGNYDTAYSCGLILNLAIDEAIRKADPSSDGLFAVWRAYIARAGDRTKADEADFIAAVEAVGGETLAQTVEHRAGQAFGAVR